MKARFNRRWALASRANLALALTLFTTGSALAALATPEKGLHARRLPPSPRRNPERPRHHRLPAAAKGQPQRCLPGGVRAVREGGAHRRRNRKRAQCATDPKRAKAIFLHVKVLAPRAGFEPATIRLTVECSTAELPRNRRNNRSRAAAYNKASGPCKGPNRPLSQDIDREGNRLRRMICCPFRAHANRDMAAHTAIQRPLRAEPSAKKTYSTTMLDGAGFRQEVIDARRPDRSHEAGALDRSQ
jgi:hypothetical protein